MSTTQALEIEQHPWEPFLPSNAKLLLLGSFPPPRKRRSMDFYYPNITNDFWKIVGSIFFDDSFRFIIKSEKRFNLPQITDFLENRGIALYDVAAAVIRKENNASDLHLHIVEPTDIKKLLSRIPHCRTIAVTGEKAAETLLAPFGADTPKIGCNVFIPSLAGGVTVWRMPSTSRAYPLALEKKAAYYRRLFEAAGITL